MSNQFKEKLKALDAKISQAMAVIKPLTAERKMIVFSEIKLCPHDLIYSMSGKSSPYDDDKLVCRNCGLSITRGIGTMIQTPLLDFSNSEIVIPKSVGDIEINLVLSDEQKDALTYPKRFNPKYLDSLLSNTPFDAQEVFDKDTSKYTYSVVEQYNSSLDWNQKNKT